MNNTRINESDTAVHGNSKKVHAADGATKFELVRSFWNQEACGSHFVTDYKHELDFFEKYREFRYRKEWHIPLLVPFSEARGKNVLEIGCGNGADGVLFAQNGALYTGVDLTQTAIEATKRHFDILGLAGSFQIENAEKLSFNNSSFDIVYSHGVLHHSPVPLNAIKEVFRVLQPGGKAIIMLYHKNSFNYYVRILVYMRIRILIRILRYIFRWRKDKNHINKQPSAILKADADTWDKHYFNFLKTGWRYLTSNSLVHHCTDGPECPYAYVYSKKEAGRIFSMFREVDMHCAHLPLGMRWKNNRLVRKLEEYLAPKIGFYLFIIATKGTE